jgi:hypothetical protein
MSVYSWQKDSMTEGGLYRYIKKVPRMLFSDLAISDYSNRWEYGIAEIQHDNVIVFLEKHIGRDYDSYGRLQYTMIKVLTSNGEVGWVGWNSGDWEKAT